MSTGIEATACESPLVNEMNGFADKGLNEGDFGGEPAKAYNVVKAFDAFPKTKPSYTEKTSNGGLWTIALVFASFLLATSEFNRWWAGHTTHTFSVEQGVGRDLQINMDVVVKMQCDNVHVNLQDASGDRVLAQQALKTVNTTWLQYTGTKWQKQNLLRASRRTAAEEEREKKREYREEDVHDYLGSVKTSKDFKKTPKVPRGMPADSCRIYGTMHTNKVQGDFHITARGHGYMEFGEHLDHASEYAAPMFP